MMRAFSRVVSLILAMTMIIGMTGITVVFAATEVTSFDISKGNITIKDSGNGFEVTSGSPQVTTKIASQLTPITITGGRSDIPAKNTITVQRGNNTSELKLNLSAVYVNTTPTAGVNNNHVVNIQGAQAPTTITLIGENTLIGSGNGAGIVSAGSLTITGAADTKLRAAGNTSISAKTIVIKGCEITAENAISATDAANGTVVIDGSAKVTTTLKGSIKAKTISMTGSPTVTVGTPTTTGNVLEGATTQHGGTLTVGGGIVTNLTANGGTTNLNAGKIDTLTIGGANVTMSGTATVPRAATLNAGQLKVTGNAQLAGLARTGGTYIDHNYTPSADIPLFEKTFTGLGTTATGVASLGFVDGKTRTYEVKNGSFKACVPNTAINFDVTFNGKNYKGTGSTNAAAAVTLKEVVAPPQPTTPTVTMAVAPTSKYKQDIVINYTCSPNTTASAFANAIGSVKLGSTALTLNAKNGYTVVPKDATTGVITIKGAANKAVANNVAITVTPKVANSYTVTNPSPINVGKNTGTLQVMSIEAPLGTSSTKLKNDYVPTGVTIKLDGTTETENFPVTWVLTGYRENTRTKQTFSSTKVVKNPMENLVTLSPADKKATLEVTLYREESSSSSSSYNDNGTYDDVQGFWSDVKDEIEFAENGDKINVELGPLDKMPTSVLDKLKGKDVTLVLERSTGSDIVISGKKVKSPPSNLIYYSVSELATMYKGGSTTTSSSSSSSTTGGTGGGTTTKPSSSTAPKPSSSSTAPTPSSSKPAVTTSSSSSESSESSSESSESISEEESSESSEEDNVPAEKPEEKPEKKKISPLMAVVIVTAGVAVLAGGAALIVLRNR